MRPLQTLTGIAALLSLLTTGTSVQAQGVLTEWVETNPTNATDRIALGYPPPIPVDTPMPFDGFRTYAGLHSRHQDLAATTPYAHPESIGMTRAGRTIWAYRLGDEDTRTPWGTPEAATLTNGGIHAREWQTPETVTGILELMTTEPEDQHFYDYLRDQVNMVVIPVLNIDGFLQTQRYPTSNYLGTDPDNPDFWPRDGRMRRKNMLDVDEDLATTFDHLFGVDLNRNNEPYWDTTGGERSSINRRSLVHHGFTPQSEPETRALDAAAALGPADRLSLYTDVHSYSMVHFWSRSSNERLTQQTEAVLSTFTNHHIAFPAGKWYAFAGRNSLTPDVGIGTTDEYFTVNYGVPSWTLEIEPSNGQTFHAPLPGGGADYGGEGNNGHDGFILPESQIKRVREELAQSFAAVYYRQSGPPHVQSARFIDKETGAVVYEMDWDQGDDETRVLHTQQLQPMVLGRKYLFWLGFSKPMFWLEEGEVVPFPGQPASTLDVDIDVLAGSKVVDTLLDSVDIPLLPGAAPNGYLRYQTDALWAEFSFQSTADNRATFAEPTEARLRIRTTDMVGLALDANPGTVAGWANGSWARYEDSSGNEADFGGRDENISVTITTQAQPRAFTLEPGIAAAWYDIERSGEGFIIEMLDAERAVVYWFTYNELGEQDWYIGLGSWDGNRLRFPELVRTSGGLFGPDFDPALVTREVVGSATFTWTDCSSGSMDWHIGNDRGRQTLSRITRIQGLDCGLPNNAPVSEQARFSGAWFDPDHDGEGYTLEILGNNSAAVYWFSFDPEGKRRWFFGTGELLNGVWVFPEMNTSSGPVFGADFDTADLQLEPWGSLELELSCDGGVARYNSTEPGFGDGELVLQQLTHMVGLGCD